MRDQYITQRKPAPQIASEMGCDSSTVYYWMKKHGIESRLYGEANHMVTANHVELTDYAMQWIEGELLGDGCIYPTSEYSALFQYASKHSEYIKYLCNSLESMGIKQSGKIYDYTSIRGCYHYHSKSYIELMDIRNRWYNNRIKIIPVDIRLTPTVVKQWYIGDGCLINRKHKSPRITLSTNGFSIRDVTILVAKLKEIGIQSARWNKSNVIGISALSTKSFLDYIGECPVECYKYKWDYRGGLK